MEPNLQPAFTFTARQNKANIAKGLDSIIKTQLVTSHAKTPFEISQETTYYPNNVLPIPNELEVLDVRTVLPIAPPIYVQPSVAEGLTAISIDDKAQHQITSLLSANNALRRGNFKAAEYLLKRPLSAEEIANKTVTPDIRSSQNGTTYAVGPRAGPQGVRGQAYSSQEKRFGDLDVRFKRIALKFGLDAAAVSAAEERYHANVPHPRSADEYDPRLWDQAINAVEQEIRNAEQSGRHHIDKTSFGHSASGTSERRQQNQEASRSQRQQADSASQSPPQAQPNFGPIQGDNMGKPINSELNQNTDELIKNGWLSLDPTVWQQKQYTLTQLDRLMQWADDPTYNNDIQVITAIQQEIKRVSDMQKGDQMSDEKEREQKGEPMDLGRDEMKVPGMEEDQGQPMESPNEMKYDDDGNPHPAGPQVAQAPGLPPNPGPMRNVGRLGGAAASMYPGQFNIVPNMPMNVGLPGLGTLSLSGQQEVRLPEGLNPLPTLSINRGNNMNQDLLTAATRPQLAMAELNLELAQRRVVPANGNQDDIINVPIPNALVNENQRSRPVGIDREAAEILSQAPNDVREIHRQNLRRRNRLRGVSDMQVQYDISRIEESDIYRHGRRDIPMEESVPRGVRRNRVDFEDNENDPGNDAYSRRLYIEALRDQALDAGDHETWNYYNNLLRDEVSDYNAGGHHPALNRRSGVNDRRHNPGGAGISGGGIRADSRQAKRRRLDERSKTGGRVHIVGPGPEVVGIDGFYGSRAPITSHLMRQTGRDAIPISGQVQVSENHQFTEAPLRQFIRQPQVVEDIVAEYEPIAVNTQLRVQKPKASTVFDRGHYGKFLINHLSLEGKKTLSLSYQSGKKIRGIPNKKLNDREYSAVKKVLGGGLISASDKLTKPERQWLAELHRRAGIPMHPGLMTKTKAGGAALVPGDPVSSLQRGSGMAGALANVNPKQKIMDILGEMGAGNDNPALKKQLQQVANMLLRRKQITPQLYEQCKQHWT